MLRSTGSGSRVTDLPLGETAVMTEGSRALVGPRVFEFTGMIARLETPTVAKLDWVMKT